MPSHYSHIVRDVLLARVAEGGCVCLTIEEAIRRGKLTTQEWEDELELHRQATRPDSAKPTPGKYATAWKKDFAGRKSNARMATAQADERKKI